MMDFVAQYCHKHNDSRINPDMFTRAYDRPLVEYILDSCKNLEVIPAIKLESWEYITDQTKIRSEIDKSHVKDPKIRNNRTLERLEQPNKTLFDMLVLHFRVTAKGRSVQVTRKVRILKQLKDGSYIRNGRKVILLNQVVDNSTYVKYDSSKMKTILNFKTTLYPIKLTMTKKKLKFVDGETMSCQCFSLDLFSKECNPLLYFLAHYGIEGTIEKFNMQGVMSIVDDILDEDQYMYIRIRNGIYLEVHEKAFYAHEFVSKFVTTLADALLSDNANTLTIKQVYDVTYWLGRLAEVFSKKRNPEKGARVLISFEKMMDPSSKKRLALRKFHKKDTYSIIRWMMVNYEELLKKDSNDLKYKRIRSNEVLAYFFDKYITKNVYSLLNTDNPPFDKYLRLLNSINENTLLRASQGDAGSQASSMFRYERYNDFDAIDLSRYTLKGPTGLNGGKKGINMKYRDIYPSQLGRFDLNVCSSSDPGLTGYLSANVKLCENGYFDDGNNEPDVYDDVIDDVLAPYGNEEYTRRRTEYIHMQLSRDKDGFIRLHRKLTVAERNKEFQENPFKYGLYRSGGFLHLKPRMANRDSKGFITLTHKQPLKSSEVPIKRDPDGFIRLRRVETKLDRKKKK